MFYQFGFSFHLSAHILFVYKLVLVILYLGVWTLISVLYAIWTFTMTQARAITYTNRNCGLKRNWSLLQETRFYCHDTIGLISSWNVTSIDVIRRKCNANVYLSKFTLNKNMKFKDFIDMIFIFLKCVIKS